jgi:hypothetical protein
MLRMTVPLRTGCRQFVRRYGHHLPFAGNTVDVMTSAILERKV